MRKTNKFVPREKMSKKARRQLDRAFRRGWGDVNPVTRRQNSAKIYNRKKLRREDMDPSDGVSLLYFLNHPE